MHVAMQMSHLEAVYSVYCSRFGTALSRYEELAPRTLSYHQECKELCHNLTTAWDLPSLLIKPVQRCLKYPLFLQSLVDCTPDTHPDYPALAQASARLIKVAETINELKRRQEIVGQIVKPRNRSDGYGSFSSRKSSTSSQKVRSVSGEAQSPSSLSESVARKFRRHSSKLKSTFAWPQPPPPFDASFDALIVTMEKRQKAIYSFILEAKAWSKAVRFSLVCLLQLSLEWKNVYAPFVGAPNEETRSGRTVEYFATSVVKSTLEGPWHELVSYGKYGVFDVF